MDSIVETADGGMAIFNGDNVDIVIETPLHYYYQFVVSPSGELLDMDRSRRFHYGWSSLATVATHRDEAGWSVEIQVPAAGADARDLDPEHGVAGERPREGAPWYFNMGRNRPRTEGVEFSVFAPTGRQHFHYRFLWGQLLAD